MLDAGILRGAGWMPLLYHAGLLHRFGVGVVPVMLICLGGVMLDVFATVSPTYQECNLTFNQSTGVISSPGYPEPYPASLDCTYTIQRPREGPTAIRFTAFDLEQDEKCGYDYVEIWEGHAGVLVAGPYCGVKTDLMLDVPSNLTIIKFRTDTSTSATGFSLVYDDPFTCETAEGVCVTIGLPCSEEMSFSCGDPSKRCCTYGNEDRVIHYTEDSGVVLSPGYPSDYPNSHSCMYIIRRPTPGPTALQVLDFDLEYNEGCTYDRLEVFDGPDGGFPSLGRFCGISMDAMSTSGSNVALFLRSDGSVTGRGFKIQYMPLEDCGIHYGFCHHHCAPSSTFFASCPPGHGVCCRDGSDFECIDYFIAERGLVESPYFPAALLYNLNCIFVITNPHGRVALAFLTFDLGDDVSGCTREYVQLYDGPTLLAPALGPAFCGARFSHVISTGSTISIQLCTDGVGSNRGFQAAWEAPSCGFWGGYCGSNCSNYTANYEYDDCEDGQRCCLDDCESNHTKTCPGGTCIKESLNCVCPDDYFVCQDFTCSPFPENCVCSPGEVLCWDFSCARVESCCPCRAAPNQTTCSDGCGCYGWEHACDGTPQCADSSDEAATLCPAEDTSTGTASSGLNAGEETAIVFGVIIILFIAVFAYCWIKMRRLRADRESPAPQLEETTLSTSPSGGAVNHVVVDDYEEDNRTLEELYGHYATPPPSYEEGCTLPRVVRASQARDNSDSESLPPHYDTVC